MSKEQAYVGLHQGEDHTQGKMTFKKINIEWEISIYQLNRNKEEKQHNNKKEDRVCFSRTHSRKPEKVKLCQFLLSITSNKI